MTAPIVKVIFLHRNKSKSSSVETLSGMLRRSLILKAPCLRVAVHVRSKENTCHHTAVETELYKKDERSKDIAVDQRRLQYLTSNERPTNQPTNWREHIRVEISNETVGRSG